MPTPRKGEKRKDWLDRCMGDPEQKRSFPDEQQRYAVCNSKWNRRSKAEATMVKNALVSDRGELLLYGVVGAGLMFDEDRSFTARDVAVALAGMPRTKPITIRLNSGGGIATEGAAIYALLRDHQGKKTMIIEGVAASAASLIAMAGDDTVMKLGATMMIHDPAMITIGTSATHSKAIEALETMADNYAEVYAEKTGETPKKMRDVMKAETWYTAADAVKAGLADSVDKGSRRREPSAFDYRLYQNAPSELATMAADRNWQMRAGSDPAEEREEDMPKELTDAEKAALAETRKSGITMACKLGGKPDRATAFVADATMTVDKVIATLQTEHDAEEAAKAKEKNGGAETPAQMQERVRNEEKQRCADISAACTMAGRPSKTADFIARGNSVTEVLAALQADKSPVEGKQINGRGGQGAGSGGGVDMTAVATSWNKSGEKYNQRFGK